MRIIKKSIYYSLAFLGFTGMISTAILSVATAILSVVIVFHILTPDSPGNKYEEEFFSITMRANFLTFVSYFALHNSLKVLTEIEKEDREMDNIDKV